MSILLLKSLDLFTNAPLYLGAVLLVSILPNALTHAANDLRQVHKGTQRKKQSAQSGEENAHPAKGITGILRSHTATTASGFTVHESTTDSLLSPFVR